MQQPSRRGVSQTRESRAELDMLAMQRGELQSQLEQLAARRAQLVAQSRTTPEGPARRDLEARISEIDARSARIDGQIQALNDRIVEAMGRTGSSGQVIVEPRVNVPTITIPQFEGFPFRQRGPDMRQVGAILAAEAVLLTLVGVIVVRIGMKRMREQFERIFRQQAEQVNQLQQAVDVIGIEVERISEGQRYVAKVLAEGSPAAVLSRKDSTPAP